MCPQYKLTKDVLFCTFKAQGPVPERQISANPGSKFLFHFCILPSYVLLRVTFCVIITVSRGKGSTVCCKLQLHVLRQEDLTSNLA